MWKVVKQVSSVRPLILIGAGNVGTSLCLNYNEFEGKGLKIVAAFDSDPRKCGTQLGHIKSVEHVSAIKRIAKESGAKIAILAISGEKAQEITKLCVDAGISTILNYSPVSLNVPKHVHVEYMDPALKIQMTLSNDSTQGDTSNSDENAPPFPFGAMTNNLSSFLPFSCQPITPLLSPLRIMHRHYYTFMSNSMSSNNTNVPRGARGYHTQARPSFLHSDDRFASDFEELGLLGKGGFGSVYKARNRMDGMDYAVKKIKISINPDASGDLKDLKYLREVRAMARLNHPNLIRYYYAWMEFDQQSQSYDPQSTEIYVSESSSGILQGSENEKTGEGYTTSESDLFISRDEEDEGEEGVEEEEETDNEIQARESSRPGESERVKVVLFIQMELCSGVTLRDWMWRSSREVDLQECREILTQLVKGLHHIHAHGFIHRDVTPPNIFLENFPDQVIVKIGDFGLAKRCGDLDSDTEVLRRNENGKSDKTKRVGTYLYASPEQLSNGFYDTRADMYSVGVILYELLRPFTTQMERISHLTQLKEGHIHQEISTLYPYESGIIERLLSKNPADRPSADELIAYVK